MRPHNPGSNVDRSSPQSFVGLKAAETGAKTARGGRGGFVLLEEAGSSVLEVTVALALFVSVLLPAVGGALRVMTRGSVQPDVEALARAQRQMERTLRHRRFRDAQWLGPKGRWAYERSVRRRGRHVTIHLQVWRARGTEGRRAVTEKSPLVSLRTTRLARRSGRNPRGGLPSGPGLEERVPFRNPHGTTPTGASSRRTVPLNE
jgi:hypothetical protein